MTTRVNAALFDLAYAAVSKEETRYYLNGVHIEAHPQKGALLVSTDGHRMVVVHDVDGQCDSPVIVQLPTFARQLCRTKKAPLGVDRRILEIDTELASATVVIEALNKDGLVTKTTPLVTAHKCLIEGTFPDWRWVIPSGEMEPMSLAAFNPAYVAELGAFAAKLGGSNGYSGRGSMYFIRPKDKGATDGQPTVVRFSGIGHVFAVLTPMRADFEVAMPGFLSSTPVEALTA